MIQKQFETATLFLNRNCPRGCTQCGISKTRVKHLSGAEWIEKIDYMRNEMGVTFFLILGTEPLMMGEELVDIIKHFTKYNIFYGMYSTSPQPLFDKYKQKLIDAGLTNWAAGIDTLPGSGLADPITEKKTSEAWEGLRWMAERGVQTFTVTTVTNYNLSIVPQILEKAQKELGNCLSCINPVEWAHSLSFDFFSKKEDMMDMVIPAERHNEVIAMCSEVLSLTRVPGYQIQNPDSFLLDFPRYYSKLNYVCNGQVGFGVDCDGSMRLCGYNKGTRTPNFHIDDIKTKGTEFFMAWYNDAQECEGCHWSYIHALQETFASLIPESVYFKNRQFEEIPNIYTYLANETPFKK